MTETLWRELGDSVGVRSVNLLLHHGHVTPRARVAFTRTAVSAGAANRGRGAAWIPKYRSNPPYATDGDVLPFLLSATSHQGNNCTESLCGTPQ